MSGAGRSTVTGTGQRESAPPAGSRATAGTKEGLRVMIVENHDKLRGILEDVLQKYGHRISSFATAEEGLSRLEADRFDVLHTDLHLPGMDGWELIAKAKAVQPSLHVLLLTGDGGKEVYERARDAGVDVLMEKPMEFGKLLAYLNWIDRKIHEERKDIEKEPG